MKIDRERRKIICGNLNDLLEFLFWSGADLAHAMIVSPDIVSKWRRSESCPLEKNWKAMRMVCEIRANDLWGNGKIVNPAFEIPDVTFGDLLQWQIESFNKVPDFEDIGS